MDRDTITLLTLAVRIYRQLRTMGVYDDMALELKGLKANMTKLQARVDRLNSLAAAGDEKGARLEGHLADIGNQLGAHVDDIEFAANMLGNSPPPSEPHCAKCGSTVLMPIDYRDGDEVKHGMRCTTCGTIAEVGK